MISLVFCNQMSKSSKKHNDVYKYNDIFIRIFPERHNHPRVFSYFLLPIWIVSYSLISDHGKTKGGENYHSETWAQARANFYWFCSKLTKTIDAKWTICNAYYIILMLSAEIKLLELCTIMCLPWFPDVRVIVYIIKLSYRLLVYYI